MYRVCLLLASVLFPFGVIMGASAPADACSLTSTEFKFVGEAVARNGDVVTFRVDEATPGLDVGIDPSSTVANAPLPEEGSLIGVTYRDGDSRFLEVGKVYSVIVWGDDAEYRSGVHTAEESCGGGGTTYADRSAIDTGVFRALGVDAGVIFLSAAAVLLAAIIGIARLRRRRGERELPSAG